VWWLIYFPMRYGMILAVAAWDADHGWPIWIPIVVGLLMVFLFALSAPKQMEYRPRFAVRLVLEAPLVALALALGWGLGLLLAQWP
jgi:hypothetical protein